MKKKARKRYLHLKCKIINLYHHNNLLTSSISDAHTCLLAWTTNGLRMHIVYITHSTKEAECRFLWIKYGMHSQTIVSAQRDNWASWSVIAYCGDFPFSVMDSKFSHRLVVPGQLPLDHGPPHPQVPEPRFPKPKVPPRRTQPLSLPVPSAAGCVPMIARASTSMMQDGAGRCRIMQCDMGVLEAKGGAPMQGDAGIFFFGHRSTVAAILTTLSHFFWPLLIIFVPFPPIF